MIVRLLTFITLAVMLGASAALATPLSDCNQDKDDDRRIRGCTELIRQDPNHSQLAEIYFYRSIALAHKGDTAHALEDLTQAIRLDPKDAGAYYNRGTINANRKELDLALGDFSEAIKLRPSHSPSFNNRGLVYSDKKDLDLALADYTEAIRLDPKNATAYGNRGTVYRRKGSYDLALADYAAALKLDPKNHTAYNNRGNVYRETKDYDRAIADYDRAIELDPKRGKAYGNRGHAYRDKGDFERAFADYNRAIQLDPKYDDAFIGRGRAHVLKGDFDRALADFNAAIKINNENLEALQERAAVYESRGLSDLARADYRAALALPATGRDDKGAQEAALAALARLDAAARLQQAATTTSLSTNTIIAPLGRRVALVIGNADYTHAGRLSNTMNDARAIAASLRRLGFAEVIERHNLGLSGMTDALKDFGDKTIDADWAVVYFAGHGIEMSGNTYLVPTDAKLARDTHVQDEALALDRVLSKVETARRLRLVILDSCRNNPFLSNMARTVASRSIGRGLARIEPEGGVLVAYSAKHGTTASDGSGANSPFAEALLANLEEPGLELQFLFRKVRDRVMEQTQNAQEPFLYGSLSSQSLYFKQ